MENKYQLSKKLHVCSKASIHRFAGDDNGVDVLFFEKEPAAQKRLKYDSNFFTVFRKWDHGAEQKMGRIERNFQQVADKIISHKSTLNLSPLDHFALTEYFFLWCARGYISADNSCEEYIKLNGVKPDNFTADQQELLESRWVSYYTEEGMPSRFLQGYRIRQHIDKWMYETNRFFGVESIKWGLIVSEEQQFFCADFYKTQLIFPISPYLCLLPQEKDRTIDKANVHNINGLSREQAHRYIFGKNIFTE